MKARKRAKTSAIRSGWLLAYSPDPTWPAGAYLTQTGIDETLKMGHFPLGAVLYSDGKHYEVRRSRLVDGATLWKEQQELCEVNWARLKRTLKPTPL